MPKFMQIDKNKHLITKKSNFFNFMDFLKINLSETFIFGIILRNWYMIQTQFIYADTFVI